MFSKEEKTEWVRKQIKIVDRTQIDLKRAEVGRFKTLEIEKEILEDWIKMRGFLNSDEEIIIGKDLTDEEVEKLLKQIKESKDGKAEPMHICIVHQTKPEDLPR